MSDTVALKPIILVVDDTPANLRLLAQMLGQNGFEVRVANNGTAALRAVQAILPDVILLDVMMPEMDGYQTCVQLKQDERTREIPVLFLSALDEVEAKVLAFNMGGSDYITKPFQVEEVLARVKTHLSLRNLQRQLAAANAELQQKVEQLQLQNEELDAFAHTVAHDLKNPLNNIVGYSELLQRRETLDPALLDEIVGWIREGGLKMNDIVESLLLLAGVRKQEVIMEPLDMQLVVESVLRRLQFQIQQSGAQVLLPESWPTAVGYAAWVEQVWTNYLSNAIKYGGEPPVIKLYAAQVVPTQPGDGRVANFFVHDNGSGLTADERAQLFKPFARLHTERASGHGLGLTIVERIIRKMGGSVGVESQPGQGSTFYFTLPGG